MRDQGGSLDERAFSVLFAFHFVTDLAFSQPFSFHRRKPTTTTTTVGSSSSGRAGSEKSNAGQPMTRKSKTETIKRRS